MRLLLVLLVGLAFMTSGTATVRAAASRTSISGGGLTATIRFTAIDEDAFFRRINVPPKLNEAPVTAGKSYTLTSPYWDIVLRGDRSDKASAEADAHYFPDGGFIRARQNGTDVWLALDLRQRAIIDRYTRLGEARALPPEPGELEILTAAARRGERIGVQVSDLVLTDEETARFWVAAGGQRPAAAPAPLPERPVSGTTHWILITLPEGRTVQFLYSAGSGTLVDSLGTEFYAVPPGWLVPVLGPPAGPDFEPRATDVPQDKGRGSPLWWLAAGSGGMALIGAGVWLQRRIAPNRA